MMATATVNSTAQHTHDCAHCTPLGSLANYDLYFCRQTPLGGPTVVARWGSRGCEYTSGINSANVVLREAQRRAEEQGLL
jgi:hypothetical protein